MDNEQARLAEIIHRGSLPMEPVPPPPLPPEWEALVYAAPGPARPGAPRNQAAPPAAAPVRAVLFDVYGTLFCSAAGDIGTTGGPGRRDDGLDSLAGEYAPALTGKNLRDYFQSRVREIHRELSARVSCPEVRVEEIWARFLRENGGGEQRARELALRYELAVNPVYPMPGAGEVIARLQKTRCVLGIISNAQFFTPLLFAAFLGGLPEDLGFDPALLVYSFELGEAKPGARLFARAANRLAERGIPPAQCLFVGNDMLTDIYGAVSAGFRGVLFAGDRRSLRLREGDARIRGLKPSHVIRRLADLPPLTVNYSSPQADD
ncbi:MAG: HAD family hydrolase [Treponema sp.]|jgi:putative hydrolase of the HAD superfamily|nr:HAD family hydrolase [Treponema sp.]